MARLSCFSVLGKKKKKLKGEIDRPHSVGYAVNVPLEIQESSQDKVNEVIPDKHVQADTGEEAAYEGSDEHDESPSSNRDLSHIAIQTQLILRDSKVLPLSSRNTGTFDFVHVPINNPLDNESPKHADIDLDFTQSGHISDPGIERVEFWASPILKRSCSALEASGMLRRIAHHFPPKSSHSFEGLQNSWSVDKEGFDGIHGSPASVKTSRSADKVMLKKRSSSQVLPSRSKKLWWKLFLWSHRNMKRSKVDKSRLPSSNHNSDQRGGYCSDTVEHGRVSEPSMLDSPRSFSGEGRMKNKQKWNSFSDEVSGSWPQNQWVAFSAESSSLARVDEWVNSVHHQTPLPINEDDTSEEGIFFPPSPDVKGTPKHTNPTISEELSYANTIIHSLNSSSTVAHITGMSLKVIPTMSRLSGLRSVNLSGNFIAHITPGSLPKGLHSLNLSRNKIVTIEGLRDLTRLRVLDLSYNRIFRIGQGLSSCTLIKELYLAGNKINTVEGLHRLLKLTVLDLSFNKITTTKCLGQLVANYSSLLALNLLGNPIQGNVGDDQLRKMIVGLLPRLAYLSKQPVKPQRARDAAKDSVAKAALGYSGKNSRRKVEKHVGSSGPSTSYNHKSNLGGRKNRHLSKSSSLKRK